MAKKRTAKKKAAAKKKSGKKKMVRKAVARKSAKKSAKKSATKKRRPKARKRELIDTGTDKRYVRRDELGQFQDVVDVSRSLSMDIQRQAETVAPAGFGDQGDRGF